jgi:ParB family chromosome partitioning protein
VAALVEAVDRGDVAVSAAREVARLEPAEQHEIVARGEEEILKAAAEIRRRKGGVGQNALRAYSGNNEYYTPPGVIVAVREVLGEIDLDPASCAMAQETVRATRYFTEEDDGLTKRWDGRLWMNPPYSAGLIGKFVIKFVNEYRAGNVTAGVVLVDNRTDAGWFHHLANNCTLHCVTRGRINFYNENTASSSPTNGSAFFYFGPDPLRFGRVFQRFGSGFSLAFPYRNPPAANNEPAPGVVVLPRQEASR